MAGKEDKNEEKRLKAETKRMKAEAKAGVKTAKAEAKAGMTEREAGAEVSRASRLPEGVGITILDKEQRSELVVTGLKKHQLKRLLPQINREILITIAEDRNTLRAGMMRFVREGIFQTLIKVVAGLIVGYLLLKFGLST